MARTVHCVLLKKDADGLDFAPYPGELGKRIYTNVCKEAWQQWLKHQTMLVNENRLNLAIRVDFDRRGAKKGITLRPSSITPELQYVVVARPAGPAR